MIDKLISLFLYHPKKIAYDVYHLQMYKQYQQLMVLNLIIQILHLQLLVLQQILDQLHLTHINQITEYDTPSDIRTRIIYIDNLF